MTVASTSPRASAKQWLFRVFFLLIVTLSAFWAFAPDLLHSDTANVFAIVFAVMMVLAAVESPIALSEKLLLLLLPLGLAGAELYFSNYGTEPAGALAVPIAWAGALFFFGESRFRNLRDTSA